MYGPQICITLSFRSSSNFFPLDTTMALPPKVFLDMDDEFIEFIEGEKLVARYPNKSRYRNPFGFM